MRPGPEPRVPPGPAFEIPQIDWGPLNKRFDSLLRSFGDYQGDQQQLWQQFNSDYQNFLGQSADYRSATEGRLGEYEQQIAGLEGQIAGLMQPQVARPGAPSQDYVFPDAVDSYFGAGGTSGGRGYTF